MKIAIAVWNDRVAPVLDVARHFVVVRVEAGQIVEQQELSLETGVTTQRAALFAEMGVNVILCGALSRPVLHSLESYGVDTVGFVTGEWRDVVEAYLAGDLPRRHGGPGHRRMYARKGARCHRSRKAGV